MELGSEDIQEYSGIITVSGDGLPHEVRFIIDKNKIKIKIILSYLNKFDKIKKKKKYYLKLINIGSKCFSITSRF